MKESEGAVEFGSGKRKVDSSGLTSPKPTRLQPKSESHASPAAKKRLKQSKKPDSPSLDRPVSLFQQGDSNDISKSVNPHQAVTLATPKKPVRAKRTNLATRMKLLRQERAARMQAALDADKARRLRYHEVPGRFEADRLMAIRADVSFQLLMESIAAREAVADQVQNADV
ncbi:hypothetical protein PF008_g13362 [Phytophthora fragariae]|uniref:Uncharacterized protein n=1 Tax=Phytophthora fragariae TaxID=53985 RepID=A0A6G0RKN4_9STRA|nr:hypothetical protein PF008_g13362 [Phytophthora fragariae]